MKTRKHLLLLTSALLLIALVWGAAAASLKLGISSGMNAASNPQATDLQLDPSQRKVILPGDIKLNDEKRPLPITAKPQEIITPEPRLNTSNLPGPTQEPKRDSLTLSPEELAEIFRPDHPSRVAGGWKREMEDFDLNEAINNMEIDLSKVTWLRFGRIYSPGGNATLYKKPINGATVTRSLPHDCPVFGFGYLDNYPGWAVMRLHDEYLSADQIRVPENEFQDDLDGITEWNINGCVRMDIGPAPIYAGPGTNYDVIGHKQPGEDLWSSTYWPPNPNWIVIRDKDFVGSGYGDGLAFMPAQYYERK